MNERTSSRRLLLALDDAVARLEQVERDKAEPIAIIGMSCRFPGHVHDLDSYWSLLSNGEDAITAVPPNRWSNDDWYDPDADTPGKIVTQFGGFLDDIEHFDCEFFGMSPREAVSLDPQQRILLEVAWEALENAGQVREKLAGSSTGVFVGITTNDYARTLTRHTALTQVDAYFNTGNALNAAPGRLSYFLGLQGPSMAIDTACSSSLVAIHLACQSLRLRECGLALAGGVNVILAPEVSVAISRGRMLSPDGHCKTFDAGADGYGRGEGCGIVVLKRQSDAIADGDPIVAVIRGSAVNQDGASGGFTVPSGSAQQLLIRRALSNANLTPAQIQYVEAHGTGTSLGDPIEVNAIGEVLKEGRSPERPFFLASVKANIGHLEAAAGAAGLIKVALALQHGKIPPHRPVRHPNPHISWHRIPVRIPTELTPWVTEGDSRRAGVSSFGFSGTNAHVVLEEAPAVEPRQVEQERSQHLLALSAKTPEALRQLAALYAVRLGDDPELELPDVCFSANTGRSHLAQRLAVIAGTSVQAVSALNAWLAGNPSPDIVAGKGAATQVKLGFFFGDWTEAPRVGRELYDHQPAFRRTMDRCADAAVALGLSGPPLTSMLATAANDTVDPHAGNELFAFAVCLSLVELLKDWGICPSVVAGDGPAEFAAACAAGIFSIEDGFRLLAADTSLDKMPEVCYSSPRLGFISSAAGGTDARDVAGASYWRARSRRSVGIEAGVRLLSEQQCDVALCIGADTRLSKTFQDLVRIPLWPFPCGQTPSHDRWLQQAVAELYVSGVPVDWKAFDREYGRSRVALPNYPWQRQRCWVNGPGPEPRVGDSAEAVHQSALALLQRGETASVLAELARTGKFSEREQQLLPKLLAAIVQSQDDESARRAEPFRDWLYEVEWRAAPAYGRELEPGTLSRPGAVVETLWEEARQLQAQEGLAEYYKVVLELEELSAVYAMRALLESGWNCTAGERFRTGELKERLGVVNQHERLLGRLLEMLEETGRLRRVEGQWEVTRPLDWGEPAGQLQRLRARCPEAEAELTLVERCGTALSEVLRGKRDPLPLLFPEGDLSTAASLYQDSPGARVMNGLVGKAVAEVVGRWPAGRGLRVLEIGAGTGGTTGYVMAVLPMERTEYTFTDISVRFVREVEEKYGSLGRVRGQVLDIEQSPEAQGFAGQQYELIVAANVLHATRDLRESLRHVRKLLAPGGVLVLLEGTGKVRFIDLIFGLTEGWWRFQDNEVRAEHPLLGAREWRRLLEESGFAQAAALSREGEESAGILSRQAVIVAQAPEAGTWRQSGEEGSWLILADGGGTGKALAELLRSRGDTCVVAYAGSSHAEDGEGTYRMNAAGGGDYERLLAAAGKPLRGVVHLWSVDTEDAGKLTPAGLEAACEKNCGSVLSLVQALIKSSGATPPRLYLVTRDAVSTQPGSRVRGIAQSPLWGVGRIIAVEHPELRPVRIDLDEDFDSGVPRRLCEELLSDDREDQLAFRGDTRYAARLARQLQKPADRPPQQPVWLHEHSTYLITGGLGGLGLLVADWMISRGARNLVLIGRNGPTPEANDKLKKLEEAGGRVLVTRADVSVREDVDRVLGEISRNLPPLRGIIHAAGVLDDAMLTQQDWPRFKRVMDPKATGALHLFAATRSLSLDFFVLFSSGASLLGSAGQANHAAANAFLDSFAHYLETRGVRSMSINWGAWAEVGAAAAHNVGGRLKAAGLGTIPPREGLRALAYLFANPAIQTGVLPIDWPRFIEGRESVPFLADFKRIAERSVGPPRLEILDDLNAAPAKKRRAIAATHVEDQVRQVLGLARSARMDPRQGFFELGMDSLTSMELKNRLQKSLGVTLPNTLTFDYPTTDALVDYLLTRLSPPVPSDTPPSGDSAAPLEPDTGILDHLSREELGNMVDALILDVEKRNLTS